MAPVAALYVYQRTEPKLVLLKLDLAENLFTGFLIAEGIVFDSSVRIHTIMTRQCLLRSAVCVASLHSFFLIAIASCLLVGTARSEPVRVRYRQGSVHGFAALKTLDGKVIATGETTQTVRGDRVTSRFIFRFRDGSVDDEQTVFEQRDVFKLISNHHVQRGSSFPEPMDTSIDALSGEVTWRKPDGTVTREHMDLPADLSNGLPPNLLLNILPGTPETKIFYLAPGAKPRLVHLSIRPTGTLPFTIGTLRRTATDFTIHVEVGGVVGVVAPLIGKQPADYHIFLQGGNPPAFLREEGPLYLSGPIWRVEQLTPSFAR